MDLLERLCWLALGGLLAFPLGYITRVLQEIKEKADEIKEELDEVDSTLKNQRNEDGSMRLPNFTQFALLLVITMTAFAAFASQKASNTSDDNQARIGEVSVCNQVYLGKTIRALNERTTYTVRQAQSNVKLQTAQAEFFALLLGEPPATENVRRTAAHRYLDALTEFVTISARSAGKIESYPFPTNEDLAECLYPDKETS